MRRRAIAILAVTACVLIGVALPAGASRQAEVTQGELTTFADGTQLGYEVHGKALMIRTPSSTLVLVTAGDLIPGETYGSHVHNSACGVNNAGGHYSFGHQVSGGALDGSEIWPGPFTANPNGRVFGLAVVGEPAGPQAVSVVIHAPGGAKIACADLD
ncbi:MAG TPA: hypothetical protein VFS66_14755 [Acidimicrobiia bacterium]|nr:hypothetical protein [Acidimicrobiia bacterium]